jgi:uncharacterized membrane protein
MDYLILKYIHIISSTILFGTGIGSAFYMFIANRSKNIENIYFTVKYVVIADFLFTTSAVIIQLISGTILVKIAGHEFTDLWVIWAYTLSFFVFICWIPVVWMQIKMRDMAQYALKNNTKLPDKYWQMDKWWIVLGSIAFPAVMIIFYFMVFKPV